MLLISTKSRLTPTEAFFHFIVVAIVLICYGFVFGTALIAYRYNWDQLILKFYQRNFSPLICYWDDIQRPVWLRDPNGPEYLGMCQLDRTQFYRLIRLFGVWMTKSETDLLFDALDLTNNGLLSFGELNYAYMNDTIYNPDGSSYELPMTSLTWYLDRYRRGFQEYYRTGVQNPNRQLSRVNDDHIYHLYTWW
ncbi:hypothetical protein EDD86DRAFT_211465, partial [Gorgonomyces haynaldii]